jgi:hypothetical protein
VATGSAARPIGSEMMACPDSSSTPTIPKNKPTNKRSGARAQPAYWSEPARRVISPAATRLRRRPQARACRATEPASRTRSISTRFDLARVACQRADAQLRFVGPQNVYDERRHGDSAADRHPVRLPAAPYVSRSLSAARSIGLDRPLALLLNQGPPWLQSRYGTRGQRGQQHPPM